MFIIRQAHFLQNKQCLKTPENLRAEIKYCADLFALPSAKNMLLKGDDINLFILKIRLVTKFMCWTSIIYA